MDTTTLKYQIDTAHVVSSYMSPTASNWYGLFSLTEVSGGYHFKVTYDNNNLLDYEARVDHVYNPYIGHLTSLSRIVVT
jgi:hypothetical protein